MDVHRVLERRIRRLRIHDVEYAVDRFVAADAEYGRAEDLAAVRIHHDLHEALRLAFLDGTAHPRHRTRADERTAPGPADLRVGQSHARERRIDEERVRGDAIGDFA